MAYLRINHAVKLNDIQLVKTLLKRDKLHKGDFKVSLTNACKYGFVEIAEMLLKKNDIINVYKHEQLNDCLWLAIANRKTNVVAYLLKSKRFDPSINDNNYFIEACEQGLFDIANLLMKDSRVNPTAKSYQAFIIAAYKGRLKVVKLLLSNLSIPQEKIDIALVEAVRNAKIQTVSYLLNNYDFNTQCLNNALTKALPSLHEKTINLILNHESCIPDKSDILKSFPEMPTSAYTTHYENTMKGFMFMFIILMKHPKIINNINLKDLKPIMYEKYYLILHRVLLKNKLVDF
jgi:ankyrin repeat protein